MQLHFRRLAELVHRERDDGDLRPLHVRERAAVLRLLQLAFMNKTRPAPDVAAVTEVIGRVRGKTVILSDDMIVTGGSLIAAADALLEAGAKEVYANLERPSSFRRCLAPQIR